MPGCFSKSVNQHQICVFSIVFVLWTGPFSSLRHIFSAADKAAVVPCEANGEENLTGPIRLRPQNGTAVQMVSFQKSFSDHIIQNNRHCRRES